MSSFVSWGRASNKTPYEVLGVPQDVDNSTIRKAHRTLVLKFHPDRRKPSDLESREAILEKFQEIQEAYNVLIDPTSRARYEDRVRLAELSRDRNVAPPIRRPQFDIKGDSKFEGWKGFLNEHYTCAISDTGADGNFVAFNIAVSASMDIRVLRKTSRPRFLMAHGKVISPIAKASATWRFAGDPNQIFQLEFFVLRDCVFDLMLGADFTYQAGLLSTNRHLSSNLERPVGAVHIRLVKTCGSPRRRLNGAVRHSFKSDISYRCQALPDSAAEPNLVSYAYAAKMGWLACMEPSPPQCELLQFVDGSVQETEGRLWLYWQFGKGFTPVPRRSRALAPTLEQPKSLVPSFVEPEKVLREKESVQNSASRHYQTRSPVVTQANDTRRPKPRRRDTVHSLSPTPVQHGENIANQSSPPFAFEVLRDCPWDLIVGHVFLDRTNAFTSQAHCFENVDDSSPLSLNPIVWAKGKEKKKAKKKVKGHSTNATDSDFSQNIADANTTLHATLEALALKHEQERKLKRQPKLSGLATVVSVDESTASSITTIESSSLSQIGVALPSLCMV